MTEELKQQIQEFLNSEQEVLNIPLMQITPLRDYFEELGYEQVGWDTNGWQVDFWLTMQKNDSKIIISGSLWYNSQITIEKQ